MSCKFYTKLSFYITTNQETDFIRKLGNLFIKILLRMQQNKIKAPKKPILFVKV